MLLQLLLLFSFSSWVCHAQKPQRLCNGRAEYCDRRYSNITFLASRNAPFYGTLGIHNQEVPVVAQLNSGIRYLTAHTRRGPGGEINLCHYSCHLDDAGTLKEFLKYLGLWLNSQPDEVVTLSLVNTDNLDVKHYDKAFREAGLLDYIFVPFSSPTPLIPEAWPFLGELITSNKRLVVFLDSRANPSVAPYLLDQYSYYFETAPTPMDPWFRDCMNHHPKNSNDNSKMYAVNHHLNRRFLGNVGLPAWADSPKTNALNGPGSIGAHARLCMDVHQRKPNVILVDFVTQGSVIKAQDVLNGVYRIPSVPVVSDDTTRPSKSTVQDVPSSTRYYKPTHNIPPSKTAVPGNRGTPHQLGEPEDLILTLDNISLTEPPEPEGSAVPDEPQSTANEALEAQSSVLGEPVASDGIESPVQSSWT